MCCSDVPWDMPSKSRQERQASYYRFEEKKKELDSRVAAYHTKNPPHSHLILLATDMHNVLTRLGCLRMTFDQMVFGVTEFQRCYLETLALLDYLEIYRPRKYGLIRLSTVGECIGVITNKPRLFKFFSCWFTCLVLPTQTARCISTQRTQCRH